MTISERILKMHFVQPIMLHLSKMRKKRITPLACFRNQNFSIIFPFYNPFTHKRIWMRSLGGAAMANDALITQSSTMKRLFCPNNPPFFALISINLELQGGPVPPRPPHQIRLWWGATTMENS